MRDETDPRMTLSVDNYDQDFARVFSSVCANIGQVIKAKDNAIQLAAICIFAQGHLLIEDVPGVGKTMLAKALAHSIGGRFGRVQFTPDLLPSDVIGSSVWNQSTGEFTFNPGPVFANVLLADEINRASPKTQSALLEAMAEGQVTADGSTYVLSEPFMVIATQNPLEHHGTYPLPESQLDRFLMRISIGYPDAAGERDLLLDTNLTQTAANLAAVCAPETVAAYGNVIESVHCSDPVIDYLLALANTSRHSERFALGISPRALLGLLRAAKVQALANGRTYVTPDDVKHLAIPVLAHRIIPSGRQYGFDDASAAVSDLLLATKVPG